MTSSVLRNQAIKLQLSDCKCKISKVLLAYQLNIAHFTVGGQISLEKVMVTRCLFFKQKKNKVEK